MKGKFAFVLFLPMLFGTPVYAQSPCVECFNATQEELRKCLDSAISQEDKNSCEDKQREGMGACENGECKIERDKMDAGSEVLPEKK